MTDTIVHKSGEFLKAVLTNEGELSTYYDFFVFTEPLILSRLSNSEKIIVWINLYNALMQIELVKMNHEKVDKAVFTKNIFKIAGEDLSLDKIEHGILRRNKLKQALGYLPGKYLNRTTKKWMCCELEPRIHFQLNCGAESCPMIRVLSRANLEYELNEGEKDYILSETEINHKTKKIYVSQLFLFYRKDFGGRSKRRELINRYHPYPTFKLKFKIWNWKINKLNIR